jgi:hypothetical protein
MKHHLGAVLTSGLAALALALTLLQAAVVAHGAPRAQARTAIQQSPTNRYSAPGNRSAVPWAPLDNAAKDEKPAVPESPEGRTPERRQQEEHRSPPPSRFRGPPQRPGPHPTRKAVA